jgi:hypothetical protein
MGLWTFPLAYALVSLKKGRLKYGYDFFEVDYRWALMIAIGVGLAFAAGNAMEFGRLNFQDIKQYMKSKQKHFFHFKDSNSESKVEGNIKSFCENNKRYNLVKSDKNAWKIIKKNPYPLKDVMTIVLVDGGLAIQSEPKFWKSWVDFGRNYKSIVKLGDYLKKANL